MRDFGLEMKKFNNLSSIKKMSKFLKNNMEDNNGHNSTTIDNNGENIYKVMIKKIFV
jgi:hypothetical protein